MEEVVISPQAFIPSRGQGLKDVYKVGSKLGEGAFGTVRKVTHRLSKQIRAVKIVSKKLLNSPEKQAWFQSELRILRSLDHPNILRLFESFEDSHNYYLVTELCSGGELYESIVRTGYLSEVQAANYAMQVLSCVSYCHEHGVIHRDLKLDNFMLESEALEARLKVIDFGTATEWTPGQRFADKMGTPYYIAPEVLSRNYTEKCDLWSVGVCIYILLCGLPPFPGTSDAQILRRVRRGKFEFQSPEWDLISYEAKHLVCQLLTKDPDKRISAREALDHPWFQTASAIPSHPALAQAAFDNLRRFSSKLTLQKATLTLIAIQFCSQSEREDLEAMFKSLDKDHSGTLSQEELTQGFSLLLGQDPEDVGGEVAQLMQEIDTNQSGDIDYTEFIVAAMSYKRMASKDRLLKAFQAFDLNHDGTISAEELKSMLSAGHNYPEETWTRLIQEADRNGDGVIDFEEFVAMMEQLGT